MDLGTSQAERSPGDAGAATATNGSRPDRRRLMVPLTVRRQPTSMAVLLVAAFGAFLAFLDSTIVNIAFPNIQKSFPTYGISSLSWVLNAYNIVFAAFLVAAGKLADLLGRKRVIHLGRNRVHGCVLVVRDRQHRRTARRIPGIAGCRCRAAGAGVPGAGRRGIRSRPPRTRRGVVGGGRGHRVGPGPPDRRGDRAGVELALGVSGEPAAGRRGRRGRPAPSGRESRPGRAAGTRSARGGAARGRARAADPRIDQGAGLGLEQHRDRRIVRGRRPSPSSDSCSAPDTTRCR